MSDVDSPEAMLDTPGPRKTKKDVEVQDIQITSTKTTSISPAKGGDGEEIGGTEVEKNKGEVTPPTEEEDPSNKRKTTPPKPSSRKKAKATRTKFKTTLTQDDFNFLIVVLTDASLEIAEKRSRRRYSTGSRVNLKKCSRHSSPADQFLRRP
jgi:hypothetical protein